MTHSTKKILLKTSAIIMIATLISRVFGLVRMQVINYFFSQEMLDAFWAAYKLPNTLRELLAEGALSVAFIPVFTSYLVKKGNEEASRLASNVLNILCAVVLLLVGAGVLLAPKFMPFYVSGFQSDLLRVSLAVDLAMIMLPFLFFASVGAVVMGILNGKKHFAAPAFAPVLFTLGMVTSIFIFHQPDQLRLASQVSDIYAGSLLQYIVTSGSSAFHLLGWSVLAGGVLQLLFQLPFLRGRGFHYRFSFDFKHPGVREVLKLMGPAALALGVVQFNQLMAPFFASYQAGGMAALQNSILLVQMPQGVFAIAVSTALLPTLSEQVTRKDYEGFRTSMQDGLGLVFLFMIPASLFFLFMGHDVINAIFNLGGKFSNVGAVKTAKALFYYSFGLIGMGGAVLANRFFYSMKNMKLPFFAALMTVVVNLVCNLIFFYFKLGFEFIALANSIAVTLNFIVLLLLVEKRAGTLAWNTIFLECGKIVIASCVMILALSQINPLLRHIYGGGVVASLLRLGTIVGLGGVIFVTLAHFLRVREVSLLHAMLKRRFGK